MEYSQAEILQTVAIPINTHRTGERAKLEVARELTEIWHTRFRSRWPVVAARDSARTFRVALSTVVREP